MGDTSSSDFKPALPAQQQPVLWGCGLHGIGQTGRRFVAGKGYKNPSFAQNARFIIDDERRPCQPYFSPRRGNFFLFLSRVPHLVAAGRGSYNLSTGLSTHLYKKILRCPQPSAIMVEKNSAFQAHSAAAFTTPFPSPGERRFEGYALLAPARPFPRSDPVLLFLFSIHPGYGRTDPASSKP